MTRECAPSSFHFQLTQPLGKLSDGLILASKELDGNAHLGVSLSCRLICGDQVTNWVLILGLVLLSLRDQIYCVVVIVPVISLIVIVVPIVVVVVPPTIISIVVVVIIPLFIGRFRVVWRNKFRWMIETFRSLILGLTIGLILIRRKITLRVIS